MALVNNLMESSVVSSSENSSWHQVFHQLLNSPLRMNIYPVNVNYGHGMDERWNHCLTHNIHSIPPAQIKYCVRDEPKFGHWHSIFFSFFMWTTIQYQIIHPQIDEGTFRHPSNANEKWLNVWMNEVQRGQSVCQNIRYQLSLSPPSFSSFFFEKE